MEILKIFTTKAFYFKLIATILYEKLLKIGMKMMIFRDNIHVYMLMEYAP